MKTNKKKSAEHLLEGVGQSLKTAPIRNEEWNFALCPHPTETEACFLYEYSLECDGIKTEVETLRHNQELYQANLPKFEEWVRLNPMPRTEGSEQDTSSDSALARCENYLMAGRARGGQREKWCKSALKANPHILVTTKLGYDLHFLGNCAHFPVKHWLELPAGDREQFSAELSPDRPQWGSDAFHMEKRSMLIRSLEEYLSRPFRANWLSNVKVPEHSGDYVFSWCWPRSDRELLLDFKKFLKDTRPKDQPPFHKTSESTTRKTSHKDLLKALAALRLMRAFKNNFQEAWFHAYETLDKPLYKDQPAWIKAKTRAEQEIENFPSVMLRP